MTLLEPTAAKRDDRRWASEVYVRRRWYSRCQERRTTFRHRFNCLLSNGSHRTLNSRARWLGSWRWYNIALRFFQVDRPRHCVGGKLLLGLAVCDFRAPRRATGGKITARHAKTMTTVSAFRIRGILTYRDRMHVSWICFAGPFAFWWGIRGPLLFPSGRNVWAFYCSKYVSQAIPSTDAWECNNVITSEIESTIHYRSEIEISVIGSRST